MNAATPTELAVISPTDLVGAYQSQEALERLLASVEERVRKHVPDLTTAKGRDAIASLAYAVSRSKTALDDAGKKLNEDAQAQIKAVNAQRKKATDRLDALRDEARKPLTDWERAEEERKARHMEAMKVFNPIGAEAATMSASDLQERADAVAARVVDESWQEFRQMAETKKASALEQLRPLIAAAVAREEQAAKLAAMEAELAAARAAAPAPKPQDTDPDFADIDHQQRVEDFEGAYGNPSPTAPQTTTHVNDKTAHISRVRRAAKEALIGLGMTEDLAVKTVLAIHGGKIPNVTITY